MEFTCTDEEVCIHDDNNEEHPVRTIIHNGSILEYTPPHTHTPTHPHPYILSSCLSFICSSLNGYTRPFHIKERIFCVSEDDIFFYLTMHDNVHQVDYRKIFLNKSE